MRQLVLAQFEHYSRIVEAEPGTIEPEFVQRLAEQTLTVGHAFLAALQDEIPKALLVGP